MVRLSDDTKERLGVVIEIAKITFHWGFIPAVIYMGWKQGTEPGMPPITFMSLLWQ